MITMRKAALSIFSGGNTIPEGSGTHEVGQKAGNSLNLFDMSGNVLEWCYDTYDAINKGFVKNPTGPIETEKNYKIVRGGAWYVDATYAQVTNRQRYYEMSGRGSGRGFRIVRTCK